VTSEEMGQSHLRQARRILVEAQRYHEDEIWHLVVRRCQEAVELALKGALRFAGIEVPHVHDVGVFVADHADRLPPGFSQHVARLVSISRRLRQEREVSFYGNDQIAAPPEALYARDDAEEALRDARFVLDLAEASFAS
jgi:HEPN domain-containing protein